MTKLLTKESILNAKSNQVTTIHVPEFGGDVGIKHITAGAYEQMNKFAKSREDIENDLIPSFIFSVCDTDGNLIFGVDDAETVNTLPLSGVVRVVREANKINTLTDEAEAVKKN